MIKEDIIIDSVREYKDFKSFKKEQNEQMLFYCRGNGISHKRMMSQIQDFFNNAFFIPYKSVIKICGRRYKLKDIIEMKRKVEKSEIKDLISCYAEVTERKNLFHRRIWGSNKELFEEHMPRTPQEMKEIIYQYSPVDNVIDRICDYLNNNNEIEFGAKLPSKFKRERRKKVEEYMFYTFCLQFLQGWIVEDLVGNYVGKNLLLKFVKSLDGDDSHHIDGYINDVPVNIKPSNFSSRYDYSDESLNIVKIIYHIVEDGVVVDFSQYNNKYKKIV